MCPRRVEPELVAQPVEEHSRWPLPDAHGPVTLDVAVPTHRAHPGAGTPDVAAQQQEVDDLTDGRDRVAVLGEPHRPADNDPFGGEYPTDDLVDLGVGQARRRTHVVRGHTTQMRGQASEAVGVGIEEGPVEDLPGTCLLRGEQPGVDRLEQRQVTAEPDLQKLVGERGTGSCDTTGMLRVTEP